MFDVAPMGGGFCVSTAVVIGGGDQLVVVLPCIESDVRLSTKAACAFLRGQCAPSSWAACAFHRGRRAPCISGGVRLSLGAACAFFAGGLRLPSVAAGTLTVQVKGLGVGVVGHLG